MSEYYVITSPVYRNGTVWEGFSAGPMSWEDAVEILDMSCQDQCVVGENDNAPLRYIGKAPS